MAEQPIYDAAEADVAADGEGVSAVEPMTRLMEFIEADNIADLLSAEQLSEIGSLTVQEYEIDLKSRDKWEQTAKSAMKAALQVREDKNYPFEGASNIKYPLITVAALQFNARSYPAICDGNRIVKCAPVGKDDGVPAVNPLTGAPMVDPATGQPVFQVPPGAKQAKADRVSEHMSWQLSEQMPEWESDTDTLLMQLPIMGSAFRKVWHDPVLGRNRSELVSALDFVVNQSVRSLDDAPRYTHVISLYPHEVEARQRSGLFLEGDLGLTSGHGSGDPDEPHEFLEQHRLIDLDEDGYREPYIVTVHRETNRVVRISANYRMDDVVARPDRILHIGKRQYFVPYVFLPDPEGGFYGIGFGRLLESIGAAIDTTFNQMLDAGHLQNAGGGFIGSGLRLGKSTIRLKPGVYQTVEATGTTIRDAIYNMQHPGPSPVLFNLLGMLVESAKSITAVQDILTGDTGGKVIQPTTLLAMVEQGLKVFTAIYKRIYRSLKAEFKLLFELNAEYLKDDDYGAMMDSPAAAVRADYDVRSLDVAPVADPTVVTDAQMLARAGVLQGFINDPLMNQYEMRKFILEAARIPNIDRFLQPQDGPSPQEQIGALAAAKEIEVMDATAKEKLANAAEKATRATKNVSDRMVNEAKMVMGAYQSEMDNDRADAELSTRMSEPIQ